MKRILILLMFLECFTAQGQSFAELIHEYEKECAQLVPDTTNQLGVLTHNLVPVKDNAGKVIHYVEGSVDTVWNTPYCMSYKNKSERVLYIEHGLISLDTSWIYTQSGSGTTIGRYSDFPSVVEVHTQDGRKITISLDKGKMFYKSFIERPHVCMIPLREVEPFSEHFWNWIKNK